MRWRKRRQRNRAATALSNAIVNFDLKKRRQDRERERDVCEKSGDFGSVEWG